MNRKTPCFGHGWHTYDTVRQIHVCPTPIACTLSGWIARGGNAAIFWLLARIRPASWPGFWPKD